MKYNFSVENSLTRKSVIIDGEATVRDLFNEAGIVIGNGRVCVGGKYVDDIDVTIDELGLNNNHVIKALSIVKSENAASAKVTGGACVIISEMKLEDVEKLEKYAPEALTLFDNEGEIEFVVDTSSGAGSLSAWGATFGKHTTADGKATITLSYEGNDPAKYIEDMYGVGLYKLTKLEQNVDEALAEVSRMLGDIRGAITVE